MNAVAVCESEHSHNDLNDMLKQYEINCGRSKESKLNGVIPIDLDIVIANDIILYFIHNTVLGLHYILYNPAR